MSTCNQVYEAVQAALGPIFEGRPYALSVWTDVMSWAYTVRLAWQQGDSRLGLTEALTVEELVRARDLDEVLAAWAADFAETARSGIAGAEMRNG